YEKGLARLDGDWAGKGEAGTRFLTEDHPYAVDLDIFGGGSLFERLSTARTRAGEDLLAKWLVGPAAVDEVRSRQVAVLELGDRFGRREARALLGADVPPGVDLQGLAGWGLEPRILTGRRDRLVASILVAMAVAAAVVWALEGLASPFIIAAAAEAVFALRLKRRVEQVIAPVDRRAHDLALFAGIL